MLLSYFAPYAYSSHVYYLTLYLSIFFSKFIDFNILHDVFNVSHVFNVGKMVDGVKISDVLGTSDVILGAQYLSRNALYLESTYIFAVVIKTSIFLM